MPISIKGGELMQKTLTWRSFPPYSTNFTIDSINDYHQTQIFVRVKGIGDIEENDPLREKKENLIGSIMQFDLKDVFHRFRSGTFNGERYSFLSNGGEEYDSEFHFVLDMIEEKIYDRILSEYGLDLDYVQWEEVYWEEVEEVN